MIIWEGQVQARIERYDTEQDRTHSYWFDTLDKGTSISVFNCFKNTKSLVNYFAASPLCIVDFISVRDLIQLAQ